MYNLNDHKALLCYFSLRENSWHRYAYSSLLLLSTIIMCTYSTLVRYYDQGLALCLYLLFSSPWVSPVCHVMMSV